MIPVLPRIISLLVGYICGQILTGYILGKMEHIDITKMGSGNVGTTNTLRSLGVKKGILAMIGDIGKVFLAVGIVWLIYHSSFDAITLNLFQFYAAFGCILGHNYPAVMKFKGGKGIACSAGLLFACLPWSVPICFVIFAGTIFLTRYVSLGSILAVICAFIHFVVMGMNGWIPVPEDGLMEIYVIGFLIMALGVGRHHSNIKRLLSGTENKFSIKNAGKAKG